MGILTVGVVTKPFQFEGARRMRTAEAGISDLQKCVDTLIVIPNQNLFRIATESTTFADAFAMADQVLYSGVASITDLMVKQGLVNLDFADVRSIMREMGKAMMGTGEASGDKRAVHAAEAAIANPLLDEVSMRGARGLLISITGGKDLKLYEVDEAASRIRQEVDEDANIILGATFDESLDGVIRVSVVATGIDQPADMAEMNAAEARIAEATQRLRAQAARPIEVTSAPVAEVQPQPVAEVPQPMQHYAPQRYAAAAAEIAPRPVAAPVQHYAEPVRAESEYTAEYARQAAPQHYEAASQPRPTAFIPPAAEMPVRQPRMPRAEDLPLPGQNQLRAQQRGAAEPVSVVEQRRRTLLERLASFGMSRAEDSAAHQVPQQREPQMGQPSQAPAAAPVAAQHANVQLTRRPVAPAPHPGYAPQARPQQGLGQLDHHGRPAQQRSYEEEQLEIPAFLRRQSS